MGITLKLRPFLHTRRRLKKENLLLHKWIRKAKKSTLAQSSLIGGKRNLEVREYREMKQKRNK